MNNEQPIVIFETSNNKLHSWHFSLYKFHKNNDAVASTKNIYNVYNRAIIEVRKSLNCGYQNSDLEIFHQLTNC